ncbi:hypothetical protein I302_106171 [Kwoniella bestiolae CBS 10118]|uniref:Uncharacterized protein n=1 Tax=Kwoniella bestiolae CBS 10118 TaxID=1296100 RepID=A0A1B9G392_9TREE|nr:hypothetical protein I302_05294 [Kwoniella bestiolae CBS 10118]OCF25474.1 hypothetical protein I302_05294 [Kwoniella bestiolae CBS 10118]
MSDSVPQAGTILTYQTLSAKGKQQSIFQLTPTKTYELSEDGEKSMYEDEEGARISTCVSQQGETACTGDQRHKTVRTVLNAAKFWYVGQMQFEEILSLCGHAAEEPSKFNKMVTDSGIRARRLNIGHETVSVGDLKETIAIDFGTHLHDLPVGSVMSNSEDNGAYQAIKLPRERLKVSDDR